MITRANLLLASCLALTAFARGQEPKADPDLPKPILVTKGKTYLYHLLPASTNVPATVGVGHQLLHTNLETGELRVLLTTGITELPTRRRSYVRSAVVGLASDKERLYVAIGKTPRLFDLSSKEAAQLYPSRVYVYWLTDGSKIHEFALQPSPHGPLPVVTPMRGVAAGPLTLNDNGVEVYGHKAVFRGKERVGHSDEENIVHDDGTGAQITYHLPTRGVEDGREVEFQWFSISVVRGDKFLLNARLAGRLSPDGKFFSGNIIIPSEFIASAEIHADGSPPNSTIGLGRVWKVREFKRVKRAKSWTDQPESPAKTKRDSRERATLTGHSDGSYPGIYQLAFAPDGKLLASAGLEVRLWDVDTGKPRIRLDGHRLNALAFSPDGKTLAIGSEIKTVKLHDVATGKETGALRGPWANGRIRHLAFSPDGKTLALVNRQAPLSEGGSYDYLILWDVATRKHRIIFKGQRSNPLDCLAFSPDGKTLATGDDAGVVRRFDVASGKEHFTDQEARHSVPKQNTAGVLALAWTSDGKTLVSTGRDQTTRFWNAATGRISATVPWEVEKPRGAMISDTAAFAVDAAIFAVVVTGEEDTKVRLLDARSGKTLATLEGHTGFVRSLAFSPDRKTLASGSDDRTVKLWDVSSIGMPK